MGKTSRYGGIWKLLTRENIPFRFAGANRWQSVLDWGRYQGFFPGLDEVRYTAPCLPPGGVRLHGGDTVLLQPLTGGHSVLDHNYSSVFPTASGGNQNFYDQSGSAFFRPRADSAGSTGAVSRKLASLSIDKPVGCSPDDTDELPDVPTAETAAAPPREDYWNSMAVTDVSEPEEGSGPGDGLSRVTEYYRPADVTLSCLHTAAMGNNGTSTQAISSQRRRKPAKPTKSPARFDPAFKGVTFQIETLPHPKPSLRIRSYFSIRRRSQAARPRRFSESDAASYRRRSGSLTETTSGSEHEEPHPVPQHAHGAKQCASCDTKKTPLWRDAEDGTPLCNACGIRYKKYRVRCTRCWHVPKKDGKSYPNCGRCGDLLRVSIFRRYSI
ncbi:PREDICTED: nitrogen catabolic enzyme regulatory protein-like isoform X1 [Branchiostoma belcheri]|uniref:Nitrogen catabolic enzyme regulatory protein-like isoform X1 n=1 Tax=Branchiostoma belcheri TaxID=7741 RepID=A0A6P5AQP2_BRABE|nr:PREDICTED: nitrogen catabolic enzyme regulatory protein-like isoform X1 [Branchiostoma belcheri]